MANTSKSVVSVNIVHGVGLHEKNWDFADKPIFLLDALMEKVAEEEKRFQTAIEKAFNAEIVEENGKYVSKATTGAGQGDLLTNVTIQWAGV